MKPDRFDDGWHRRRRDIRDASTIVATTQFGLAGVLALVVLAYIGMAALRSAATNEAVKQASELVDAQTRSVVQPAVTDALAESDPAAIASFDELVRNRLFLPRLVRVKLWSASGRIVYADDPRLIGQTFALSADDDATLSTGEVSADLSDLTAPENQYERGNGQLLQVYDRVITPSGTPLLFEIYLRFDSITASAESMGRAVAPAFLLALLALEILQLPLAWRMVRRIRRGQRAKEAWQRRAHDASDMERRRIARDLHDGLVQQLSGLSFSLAAVAADLKSGATTSELAHRITSASTATRAGAAELRTLVSDIYPTTPHPGGLPAALRELLDPVAASGIEVSLNVPIDARLRPEVAAALFRATQEAVRNVVSHAHATRIWVDLAVHRNSATITVRDNGTGYDTRAPVDDTRPHFGLRMLDEFADEIGGKLHVSSALGDGTTFYLELPTR
jgi:signal transduction histidine kinase